MTDWAGRARLVLALLASAGCQTRDTRPPEPASTPAAARPPAPTAKPEPPVEQSASIESVWRAELAGDHQRAERLLARWNPSGDPITFGAALASGGKELVVAMQGGVLVAEATGRPIDFIPLALDATETLIQASELTLVRQGARVHIIDVSARRALGTLENVSGFDTHGRRVVAASPDSRKLRIWDDGRSSELAVISSGSPKALGLVDRGTLAVLHSDAGTEVVELAGSEAGKQIAASPQPFAGVEATADGKHVLILDVNGHSTADTGEVRAHSRDGAVVARSSLCKHPRRFELSPDGKHVAVGDLRRACVLTVPDLKRVAVTQDVPPFERDDDRQMVNDLSFMDGGTTLVVSTLEGGVAAFRLPKAAPIWKGSGQLLPRDDGKVVNWTKQGELVVLDGWREISRRQVADADVQLGQVAELERAPPYLEIIARRRLDEHVCPRGPWLLPKWACKSAGGS